MTRPSDSKKKKKQEIKSKKKIQEKKKTCRTVDFAVLADDSVKLKQVKREIST